MSRLSQTRSKVTSSSATAQIARDAAIEGHSRLSVVVSIDAAYRRLIPKSAFMHFLAILTFLHIWKDKSQGYLKMQGPWQFSQNKGV